MNFKLLLNVFTNSISITKKFFGSCFIFLNAICDTFVVPRTFLIINYYGLSHIIYYFPEIYD